MIIGLTGYSRVGKDTVADYLVDAYGFKKIAFATALKRIVAAANPILGFDVRNPGLLIRLQDAFEYLNEDQVKALYPEYVRLLKKFGTEGIRANDENFWVRCLQDYLLEYPGNYVITDVRFPNESDYIRFDQGGILWHIDRPGAGGDGHSSEQWPGYLGESHYIMNNGTLGDLYLQVDDVMESMAWAGIGFEDVAA